MNSNENNNHFEGFFTQLLNELSEREREVLQKRYQLTSDVAQKNTLKQIGDTYGITRERVRQIEREAINKLDKLTALESYKAQLDELEASLQTFMERKGGLVVEKDLVNEYVADNHSFDTLHQNAFLFVIEFLIDSIDRVEESDDFYAHWRLTELAHDDFNKIVTEVINQFEQSKQVSEEEALFNLVKERLLTDLKVDFLKSLFEKHTDLQPEAVIASYLATTKKVEKNILGHWGLAEWPEVKPKKLSDKIHLIFKRSAKPLHFRDVAQNINEAGFDRKNICAATVHNELIANGGYVLIGRGIYARKEWGYTPGTVADIIAEIIRQTGKPMSKEEIYAEVLKQRQVNPSTIYLSLINKDKFQKHGNGLFDVK